MIIVYDTYNQFLFFKLEKKDWKDGKGRSFVQDIKEQISNEERLETQNKKEIIWFIDQTAIKKFYEIYKKYYDTKKQNVFFL